MKLLIVVALTALLGGCSSVAEIRQAPPALSLASDRPAKQVAECIRDGWQNTSIIGGNVGGILQQSGENLSIIAPSSENPWHLADVTPSGTGSKIKYHFYRTWQSPPDSVEEVVKSCSR